MVLNFGVLIKADFMPLYPCTIPTALFREMPMKRDTNKGKRIIKPINFSPKLPAEFLV